MKGYFKKKKPKKVSYRDYKNYNKEDFRSELRCVLNTNKKPKRLENSQLIRKT